MRTMYDGTNLLATTIARLFPKAEMVAGYLDGSFAWSAQDWELFPRSAHVTIVTSASVNAGDVLDVEKNAASVSQAERWIGMRRANGLYRPTIYCLLSSVPAVRQATGRFILERDYDIWVANWDGRPSDGPAAGTPKAWFAAHQYQSTENYDVSAVFDDQWPHRTPPPAPKPAMSLDSVAIKATYSDGSVRNVGL